MTVESVKEEAAGSQGPEEAEKKYIGIPQRLAALSVVMQEIEDKLKEAGGGIHYKKIKYEALDFSPDFLIDLKLYFKADQLYEYASRLKEQPRGNA